MLKSMTAFARLQDQGEWGSAVWELKTVNHRYLDISLRLPEQFRDLEMKIRELAKKKLSRGKLDCGLRFQQGASEGQSIQLNQILLDQLSGAMTEVKQYVPLQDSMSALDVLRWPGVVQESVSNHDELKKELLELLEKTFDALVTARAKEGESILEFMQSCLNSMTEQVAVAETRVAEVIKEQKQKVLSRFEELKLEVDAQRIEQEMVFMVQRLDIAEELQRLKSHIKEITSILKKGNVVGRRLDFLMQELNREANTLGSKSADIITTNVSVELKVLIEQMREQVQNIE